MTLTFLNFYIQHFACSGRRRRRRKKCVRRVKILIGFKYPQVVIHTLRTHGVVHYIYIYSVFLCDFTMLNDDGSYSFIYPSILPFLAKRMPGAASHFPPVNPMYVMYVMYYIGSLT